MLQLQSFTDYEEPGSKYGVKLLIDKNIYVGLN